MTWRRVTSSDLVTWPWKVGGHHFQKSRKIDRWVVMQNFAALRAAVFLLFKKKPSAGRRISAPPPVGARVKTLHFYNLHGSDFGCQWPRSCHFCNLSIINQWENIEMLFISMMPYQFNLVWIIITDALIHDPGSLFCHCPLERSSGFSKRFF